ncbi:MAG TPA: alpha/beta hydrolase [Mycobacteriales bacterium]|jgi:acetyl esterase/lipase|nr:alpha/beta hydrolase [Mycobacteriales bacterium]
MSEIHPELRRQARFLPRGGVGPRTLPALRWLTGRMSTSAREGVELVADGDVRLRLHRPAGVEEPRPGLLWIHGGGYVLGSPAQDDLLCKHMVERLGIVVAAVQYRLAPQHRFPVPVEDCFAGLKWLAEQDFVDSGKLAIGGASAGGGLAASLAFLARDRNVPLALQLLAYPMIDDRTATRTDIDQRTFRLWNNKANAFGWRAYTGKEPGSSDMPPLAAVARAEDLAGLAPAWIGVGTCDLFHDENVAYAERLRAAGVKCDLEIAEGAYHGFDVAAPKASVTRAYRDSQYAALTAAFS